MKNKFLKYLLVVYLLLVARGFCLAGSLYSCHQTEQPQPSPVLSAETKVAIQWAEMSLYIIQNSTNNSPTYASRALGYLGLGMYESVVNGSSNHRSLEYQVNGLSNLPVLEKGESYNWILSLNASQATLLRNLYPHISERVYTKIDSLAEAIEDDISKTEKPQVVLRSVIFGNAIARAILDWAGSDGGFMMQYQNFQNDYPLPIGESYWIAPIRGGQVSIALPLHPYWGKNRNFVASNATLPIPRPIPYSIDPTSSYYKQMLEVYEAKKKLTQEQKEMVMWWSDDPSVTPTPPGHSYNLATIAIKTTKTDIYKAVETYARVGMAVADAFINAWRCKYFYHLERPSSFIDKNIEKGWLPFFPEPPFPAFVSGHSMQIAATATVLADIYGDKFGFTDNTYEGRAKDEDRNVTFKSRSYTSFSHVAEECAMSRLYGNIHTRQDNEIGLAEGRNIGANINILLWKK